METTYYHIEIFRDRAGKPRLRLVARNGNILMSSEAYSKKEKAQKTAWGIAQDTGWEVREVGWLEGARQSLAKLQRLVKTARRAG